MATTRESRPHGVCPESPAFFMMVRLFAGDMQKGVAYGNHGMTLANRIGEPASECVALFHGFSSPLAWTSPLQTTASMLHRTYKDGMITGLTEEGTYSLQLHLSGAMMTGKSLPSLEDECKVYIHQMDELRKEEAAECARAISELIGNLRRGRLMTGFSSLDCCDSSSGMSIVEQQWSSWTQVCLGVYKMMEYAYLGEYEAGALLALQKGDKFEQAAPGNFII